MKKTAAFFIGILLLACPFAAFEKRAAKAEETIEQAQQIDMYLIAGQSNAAGYSTFGDADVSGVYPNILYGGQTDRNMKTHEAKTELLSFGDFVPVRAGLGIYSDRIGPEYGMAKTLNAYYSGERKAFIFKSAAGGTALQNTSAGSGSSVYGNWYPRSLWQEGYTPELAAAASNPAGVQYALFLQNFKTVYNELKNNGYLPVVKGMAWMQGEEDWGLGCVSNDETKDYAALLKRFIADIREDIYLITQDEQTIDMRFAIGKIASTFSTPENDIPSTINERQQKAADKIDYAETVETSDLVITYYEGTIKHKGADNYHFCGEDAVTLGERFAEKLLSMEVSKNGKIALYGKHGGAEYEYDEAANRLTLKNFSAAEGYALSSVTINGKTVFLADRNSLTDGQLVVDLNEIDSSAIRYTVTVAYAQTKSTIRVVSGEEYGEVVFFSSGLRQPAGTQAKFTVKPYYGYKTERVTYNGETLEPNEGGEYTFVVAEGENLIEVFYSKQPKILPPEIKEKTGLKPIAIAGICAAAVAAVGGITFFVIKTRKKKIKKSKEVK